MTPDPFVLPAWCPGDSARRMLASEVFSHETVGRWPPKRAGPSCPSSWDLGTWSVCAPGRAGLSASAQDLWVLVKSAGYAPRIMEGKLLIGPMQCGQGVIINCRVKSRGSEYYSAMKRSEALT